MFKNNCIVDIQTWFILVTGNFIQMTLIFFLVNSFVRAAHAKFVVAAFIAPSVSFRSDLAKMSIWYFWFGAHDFSVYLLKLSLHSLNCEHAKLLWATFDCHNLIFMIAKKFQVLLAFVSLNMGVSKLPLRIIEFLNRIEMNAEHWLVN